MQDTLLLYNPKECRGGKKACPFFLLENFKPFSPWGPLDFLSTCLGIDSQYDPEEADILEEAIKIATKTTAGSLTNIKCSLVSLSGIL